MNTDKSNKDRVLTITTVNEFHSEQAWKDYMRGMDMLGTMVDFKKLEKEGSQLIVTEGVGGERAESLYTLTVSKSKKRTNHSIGG